MRTLLEFASQTYRYTVLDVPRSDAAALDALEGATKIVLVVEPGAGDGPQREPHGGDAARSATARTGSSLVLTRTDRRAEIGLEDVERTVGIDVSHSFPSDYRLALQAMNKGRPIVLDNQNELPAAFIAFARALAGVAGSARKKKRADRKPVRPARSAARPDQSEQR